MNGHWLDRPAVQWTLRILLAGLFGYAGFLKIAQPLAFADGIATFRLLPAWMITTVAVALPVAEILLSALLLAAWRRAAALGLLVLTGVFIVALLSVVARGIEVNCGCFGPGGPTSGWLELGRNALLAIALGLVYRHELTKQSRANAASPAGAS